MGSESYLIGAGRVFFNNSGSGFLDLGNIPSINLTRAITTLDHFTFASGARQKDLSLVTESSMGLSFNIDEFNKENLNLLVFGNGTAASNQSASSAVSEAQTVGSKLDTSIFTDKTNISSVVVKDVTDVTTYVLDTDYSVINATTGEIKILSTGAIAASAVLHISYDYAVRNRTKVVPGKDFTITGTARIEIEVTNGLPLTWKINNAELKIEGDTAISPDTWSEASIVLNILVDKTVTPTEPMGALYIG